MNQDLREEIKKIFSQLEGTFDPVEDVLALVKEREIAAVKGFVKDIMKSAYVVVGDDLYHEGRIDVSLIKSRLATYTSDVGEGKE